MQRDTQGVIGKFIPVQGTLKRSFILALFHGSEEHIGVWEVTRLPAKQTDPALSYPNLYTKYNKMVSFFVTCILVTVIWVQVTFRSGNRVLVLRYKMAEIWCHNFLNSMQVIFEVTR